MVHSLLKWSAATVAVVAVVGVFKLTPITAARADGPAVAMPAPLLETVVDAPGLQTAVFAGGCFWGIQGVFQHIKGVTSAVSGYAGGTVANPSYGQVSSGSTGHAEAVRVTYDPAQVSFGTLLQIFFSVALDPTEVDHQGPDWGTQYRSDLFVSSMGQDKAAHAYLAQLTDAHVFAKPIATRIDDSASFYPAEDYHQDYLTLHPDQPYIAMNDIPKVQGLQRLFPAYWRDQPVLVGKGVEE
ncbi:peptide-methionine (S)-S-oxide reductase MsrA [Acidisphaera sp. L21]|uniref:peptide-methionine (S)-S-oxide reductase MsrA n=1 Tax=Acidisphaera sp. L21 TaxID=1641851 RepID=UPI00131E04F7|nr:peptide-methionine (S)-S-oxide reductase MsrA [Acidisphaera sp. L21]